MTNFKINCGVFLSLLLLISLQSVLTITHSFNQVSSSTYGVLVTKSFGMASRGKIRVDFSVSNTTVSEPGFVLVLIMYEDQRKSWYEGLSETSSGDIDNYCTQPAVVRRQIFGTGVIHYEVEPTFGTDQYSVAVIQCLSGTPTAVSVDVQMKNARPESENYSQLPIDEVLFPRILIGESIAYSLMIVGLLGQIYLAKHYAMPLHWVFLATLVALLMLVFAEYYDFYFYNVHGYERTSSLLAINILGVFSDAMQLSSLFLLSLGWNFVRTVLPPRERNMFLVSILAYVIFGLAGATCLDNEAVTCQALNLLAYVIKSILLLCIIIAMNFTVTQLRAMLNHSPWVPSTPLQYARCQQYQVFRIMFLLYILLPTAFSLINIAMYSWKETWLKFLLDELLTILMCFHVGVTFSPLYETLLLRSFDGSLNNGALAHARTD